MKGLHSVRKGAVFEKQVLLLVGFTLLIILLIGGTTLAERVPPGGADVAASQFLAHQIGRGASYMRAVGALPTAHVVGVAATLSDPTDGKTLGYVYKLIPVGYVVVTSDTRLTPVIAFSYTSNFSWKEDSDNILLHMLRQDLALRLRAAQAQAILPDSAASNEADWKTLTSVPIEPQSDGSPGNDLPSGDGGTVVYGPWLTTYWDQSSPYNDNCPIDPDTGERCVVGCTATALSQVLNYWQYPTSVAFPASADYVTDTREITIDASDADFTGLDYNDSNPSDTAAAALCFAAGVSVKMDYTSTTSGAHMAHWPAALAGNWSPWSPPEQRWGYISADLRSYAPDYSWWGPPYYTDETSFYDQLSTSMTQGRPAGVWISASGGGGGHSIVADGWQSGGRVFHLNYGWTYCANGWYTMPTGMPAEYSFVEAAVVNIYPTSANYTLMTQVVGAGTVQNLPAGTSHSAGTHVLVTATPNGGSIFDHWEGDASGDSNPLCVIMDGSKTVHAVFRSATSSWSDDIELGQNWAATGLWHITQQKSHSSTHSQWYGQEATGNYETGGRSQGTLTSPMIDVLGTDSVTISFWHWRSVFYYPSYAGSDQTYAEYSLDSGAWTRFWYEDSQDPSQYTWQQVLHVVTTTGTSAIQLRFGFDTVFSDYHDDYLGWFIDDVVVATPVVVSFSDPGLEAAIREAIGKTAGDIYNTDLVDLTDLDASGRSISDLEGIQHCTDLVLLQLSENQIVDISPLSGLQDLAYLMIDRNQIVDISTLTSTGFPSLDRLDIGENRIIDFSPLSSMTNLYRLGLWDSQISDISFVASLTNLMHLYLEDNQIADISPLSGLTDLTLVWLYNNQISDIGPLVDNIGLDNHASLRIQQNHLCLAPGSDDVDDINTLLGRGVQITYIPQGVCTETNAAFKVDESGNVLADQAFYGSAFNSGSADVAEWVPVSEPVDSGDVLELDPDNPGHYRKSRGRCSDLIAGVVSTDPGFILGSSCSPLSLGSSTDDSRLMTEDSALLALVGIIPVKVTNEGGAIQPGDLLVSSSTPGYAMKWNLGSDPSCAFIGKALEPMNGKTGVISIILTGH